MFQRLDNIVARELYAPMTVPVVNQQTGEPLVQDGRVVTRQVYYAQLPIIQRYLGAHEDDPVIVTGGLWALTHENEIRLFDLDPAWAYATNQDILDVYEASHETEVAVNFQTYRSGPQEGVLLNLSKSEKGQEIATKLGLHYQTREVTLPDGTIEDAGAMEVVIQESALRLAMATKKYRKKGRLQGINGPASLGQYRNEHIAKVVEHIRATGELPEKVRIASTREQQAAAIGNRLAERLAPSVNAQVAYREPAGAGRGGYRNNGGNRTYGNNGGNRQWTGAQGGTSYDDVPF